MSLILDALKRAERERRLEKAPDLNALYHEDRISRQRIPIWAWVTGALLIGIIGGGVYLWSGNTKLERSSAPPERSMARSEPTKERPTTTKKADAAGQEKGTAAPKARAPSTKASQPPSNSQVGQGVPPARQTQAKRAPQATAGRTATSQAATPAPLPKGSTDETDRSAARTPVKKPAAAAGNPFFPQGLPGLPAGNAEEARPLTPASPELEAATLPPTPPAIAPQMNLPGAPPPPQSGATRQSDQEQRQPAEPNKKASIPLLSELPYDVREKLGKLQINVHSYSEDPNERLIYINLKRLKVGDRIGENGPTLKEITPEGAVIDYGDGQLRLKVGM